MRKYKNILKGYKEAFNFVEKQVHNPNLTKKENIQNTINAISQRLDKNSDGVTSGDASVAAVGLKAIIDDMNGDLTHFFISDKSLFNFLKETEIKDTSIVNEYIKEHQSILNLNSGYYTIGIHSEDEAYCVTYISNPEKTVVVVFKDDSATHFPINVKVSDPICKLAINLIYYLKAFPEKIIEGVPQDMVKNDKKKFNSSNCHSVGIADEIVEKTEVVNGHIVSPHFRSGFFRHYADDRYVNMKGKVQFIAATMVKGKAKTVIT